MKQTRIATLIVAAGLIISSATFASQAQALSISELQSQLQALIARMTSMQSTGLNASTSVSTESALRVTAVPRVCSLRFDSTMGFGSTGDTVRGLQEFLRSEGVLNAGATGYFGAATRSAVAKWQISQGLQGVGVVGPATRAKIKARCGVSDVISATPTQGSAPLTVTVTSKIGDATSYRPSAADGQDTLIDFGDGSERQWVHCDTIANDQFGGQTMGGTCKTPQSFTHTYTKNGSYTISLVQAGGMCIGGCPERIVGTTYVQVGDSASQQQSLQADPQSGKAPLTVNFTFSPSTDESAQYWIEYGDGKAEMMTTRQIYCIRAPCISPSVATHTYTSSGTYTATVTRYIACMHTNPRCMIATMPLATVTISVEKDAIACTKEYKPVCGRLPGCVNTCPPGMYCTTVCQLHNAQTYGNRCELNAAGADFLYEGACTDNR